MRTMRLILGDRWSAGAIAVLIAQVLLLQALFAGLAQGAMAAPSGDPSAVICALHEAGSAGSQGDQSGNKLHCPCAILCQLAAAAVPTVPGGFAAVDYTPIGQAIAGHAAPAAILSHPVARGLIIEATGPPAISV